MGTSDGTIRLIAAEATYSNEFSGRLAKSCVSRSVMPNTGNPGARGGALNVMDVSVVSVGSTGTGSLSIRIPMCPGRKFPPVIVIGNPPADDPTDGSIVSTV